MIGPDEVLDFWFGAPGTPVHGTARPEWFRKDAAFDTQVRERFTAELDAALEAVLAGRAVTAPETKSYGCSVKYAK